MWKDPFSSTASATLTILSLPPMSQEMKEIFLNSTVSTLNPAIKNFSRQQYTFNGIQSVIKVMQICTHSMTSCFRLSRLTDSISCKSWLSCTTQVIGAKLYTVWPEVHIYGIVSDALRYHSHLTHIITDISEITVYIQSYLSSVL